MRFPVKKKLFLRNWRVFFLSLPKKSPGFKYIFPFYSPNGTSCVIYCQPECCFRLPLGVFSCTQFASSFSLLHLPQHDVYTEVYFITYCIYMELLYMHYITLKYILFLFIFIFFGQF